MDAHETTRVVSDTIAHKVEDSIRLPNQHCHVASGFFCIEKVFSIPTGIIARQFPILYEKKRAQNVLKSCSLAALKSTFLQRCDSVYHTCSFCMLHYCSISFILSSLPKQTQTLSNFSIPHIRSLFHLFTSTHTYTFQYSHNSHCRKPVRDTHVPVLPAFSPRSSYNPALSSSNCVHTLKILPACLPLAAPTCCASALDDRPYLPAASPLPGGSTLEDRSCLSCPFVFGTAGERGKYYLF